MTTCSACRKSTEPPTIQGMKLELPPGWAVITIHRRPIDSKILCSACIAAVDDAITLRGVTPGRIIYLPSAQ